MRKHNPFLQFIIGLAMLVAGGYWFLSTVTVTTGFYGLTFGNTRISGGLVVVPFIAGIIWLFLNFDSIGAKILTGAGLLIILASVIMSTTFIFQRRSLYEYLIMLVLIFGGGALCAQVLFAKPKENKRPRKKSSSNDYEELSPRESFEEIEDELEKLRKNL